MNIDAVNASLSSHREAGLREIGERLLQAKRVVLTTHQNADGDGVGSQAAVAAWLEQRGARVTIVNPTPFPSNLRFLLHRPDLVAERETPAGVASLREADLVLILDTSEPHRIAPLDKVIAPDRAAVIDHHEPGSITAGTMALQDPTAAATGELVYDLISLFGGDFPAASVLGIYVAIVSDTGSFRFANTNARIHLIAADLLARGVDPEQVFQRLYATFPLRRLELLREALDSLRADEEAGISWMVIGEETSLRLGATPEDFEGLVDHARSVEGTNVAILFRETPNGGTKVSLRSNGPTDVNAVAREFGGGGHVKAAGANLDLPPEEAVKLVTDRVRKQLGVMATP